MNDRQFNTINEKLNTLNEKLDALLGLRPGRRRKSLSEAHVEFVGSVIERFLKDERVTDHDTWRSYLEFAEERGVPDEQRWEASWSVTQSINKTLRERGIKFAWVPDPDSPKAFGPNAKKRKVFPKVLIRR